MEIAPRFPAYIPSDEDDDFGPEPDPALYRAGEYDDPAVAQRQAEGRATMTALGHGPSWERWG